ncbi:MAG TPA: PAS domain S-box protein [Casimicrobiaceae bacterium]
MDEAVTLPAGSTAYAGPLAPLQQIAEHTAAAMFIKDLDGRYLFVNRAFERMKGVPVEAILGRLDEEVFPAAAAEFRRNDRRVIEERRPVEFEEIVETAQGKRTYLSHKFPLLDAGGAPCAICGIATDITDRKRHEDALRAAALAVSNAAGDDVFGELTRFLAEILHVDVAMIAIHLDGDRTRMRTLAARLDGKALAAFEYLLAGSPCRSVVGREFRFVGAGVNPEFPPGTLFAAKGMDSYAAFPINDSAGRPLGLIAVMDRHPMADAALAEAMLKIFAMRASAEIERARAEAALRASEASYRAIFEASEDAIFIHDWDTGAFVDANPKACLTYGYSVDEFRGLTVADISAGTPPYTMADAARWIAKAKAGAPVYFEWRRRNRDGSLHWDEVYLKAVEIAGTRRILASTRDITARKCAEAQLRQAQKMEAIGHLAGGIAHDFNNLLTSILGYVTLAAERAVADDAKLASYLEQASLSCLRARDLIQQLLTFSRGKRGSVQPLALAPLVRASVKLLRGSFPATVALRTEFDEAVPEVLLDAVHFEQVLMNLAINARDAMRSSGEIRIAVRRAAPVAAVCAGCRKRVEGDMVELAVADTGPGIAQDVQERMFEPFFTTKPVGQGSGMGLAIVHGIVHEHGGHILVDSVPGAGASVRVLFPAMRFGTAAGTGSAGSEHRDTLPLQRFAGTIAVVDDEPAVARYMRALLEHLGLAVVVFEDARTALEAIARGEALDLVISDQTMPGMTGIELARAVRASRASLPVVLYTGYGEGVTAADLRHAGVTTLLRKPIETPALVAVLRECLQGTRMP